MKLSEVVNNVGACQLISDGDFTSLEQCNRVRSVNSLVYIENSAYADTLNNMNISCVICVPEMRMLVPAHIKGIAVAEDPKKVFYKFHNHLVMGREKRPAMIDQSANISPQAYISP